MKLSRYTYCLELSDCTVIYNSLQKKILRTADSGALKKVLEDPSTNIAQQTPLAMILAKHDILIDEDVDEKSIADVAFLEEVMSSRLDLTIMPTEDCNFRCKYCYESFKRGKMSSEDMTSFKQFFYKNIKKYNEVSVAWFGGEPSEALDEMEYMSQFMIAACKKRGIPYSAGIVSNGYNLTLPTIKRLIAMRVTEIQVTIDGTKKNHDKYKVKKDGSGTYDAVLSNLLAIRDHCQKRTLSVVIRINVSTELIDDLEEVALYFYREFSADRRFSFFFRPVGDWGGDAVKYIEGAVVKPSDFNLVYRKLAQLSIPLNYRLYHSELVRGIDICYAAKYNAYIVGSDLRIYKCSCKFDDAENYIGNIQNGEIILDRYRAAKWLLVGLASESRCDNCVLYPVCHNASCIADAVNGRHKGSTCPHMKANLDSYLTLLANDTQYITEI